MIPITSKQLESLKQIGYVDMTVAELFSHLAGLPPMMEVYALSDDISMFINDIRVEVPETGPPFLRVLCSETPKAKPPPSTDSVEIQTARKAQVSMDLARRIDESQVFPSTEDR